jgi:hypothetical protein
MADALTTALAPARAAPDAAATQAVLVAAAPVLAGASAPALGAALAAHPPVPQSLVYLHLL